MPENGKYGLVDKASGRWVLAPRYESIYGVSDGLVMASEEGLWGLLDLEGRWVAEPVYEALGVPREGRVEVVRDGKSGYLDYSGVMVIEPRFDDAEWFSEGRAAVSVRGKSGYIDPLGEVVIPLMFEEAGSFAEGLAPVKQGNLWGYINEKGAFCVQPRFDHAGSFSEGLAAVEKSGRWGFVEASGRLAIEFSFEHVFSSFVGGVAEVQKDGAAAYVGVDGSPVPKKRTWGDEVQEVMTVGVTSASQVSTRLADAKEAMLARHAGVDLSGMIDAAQTFAARGDVYEAVALYELVLGSCRQHGNMQDPAVATAVEGYMRVVIAHAKAVTQQANEMEPGDKGRMAMLAEANALNRRAEEFLGIPKGRGSANATKTDQEDASKCFVATAVFQDAEAPTVRILREYRDRVLVHHHAGRMLIASYHAIGPSLARLVGGRESVRKPLRWLLAALARHLDSKMRADAESRAGSATEP